MDAQDHTWLDGRLHNLSEQPLPMFVHPHSKKVVSCVQMSGRTENRAHMTILAMPPLPPLEGVPAPSC